MTILESEIIQGSEEFSNNSEYMLGYLKKLNKIEKKQIQTEENYRERAKEKGKLLPRERLALLLDPGTPFVEIGSIAGLGMYGDENGTMAGGTLIAGIGYISGRRCMAIIWNFAIKGGTITAVTVKKMLRIQKIVFEQKLPLVSLHESGGGNLGGDDQGIPDPWAPYTFVEGGIGYGQQAELTAAGIPQITVAHGNATAGGAYQVALSDYIILVKEKTQMFLAGPPLLKAATGEVATHEELGGAEMHATISGTGEYLAEDDADGIRIAREIVAHLPKDPKIETETSYEEPLYSPDELIGVVPVDKKTPYKVHEVIARLADGSDFFEFNPSIDFQTICGHFSVCGKRVGVIGNNGPITPNGALKASQFIQLCDLSFTPVIFLHNTTGFLVGKDVEQAGQVKAGAKMIQAVANMRSPKISIIVGNSYGAGNYAMAGKALKPDFVFAWPVARQCVMGGAQAATVMEIVAEGKAAKAGIEIDEKTRKKMNQRKMMVEMGLEIFSESFFCSARLMDDGIIDPRDTRKLLSFLLDTCLEGQVRKVQEMSYGVPRF